MKSLILIRHAKSSWDDPDLDDFDRPLNDRGVKDAPRMGKRLKEKGLSPDQIIASPAARAFTTAEIIAGVMGCPAELIQENSKLYHADEETLLSVLRAAQDKMDCIFMVGHNPGLTEFANALLQDKHIDNIPTAGVVGINFDLDSWSNVKWGSGKMVVYDYPKNK